MITFNKRRGRKVSLHRTRDAVAYRAVSYILRTSPITLYITHQSLGPVTRSPVTLLQNVLALSKHRHSLSLFAKFWTSVKGAQRDRVRRGERSRSEGYKRKRVCALRTSALHTFYVSLGSTSSIFSLISIRFPLTQSRQSQENEIALARWHVPRRKKIALVNQAW